MMCFRCVMAVEDVLWLLKMCSRVKHRCVIVFLISDGV